MTAHRVRVDWPACRARGLCAELLPEAVVLDEWGYPLVTADVPDDLLPLAQEAVHSCPHLALRLVAVPTEASSPAPSSSTSGTSPTSGTSR